MDQGIIRSLKARYRTKVIRKYIAAVDAKKPLPKLTVLDAMTMLVAAWDGVSEITVVNCFKKAGICKESQESSINDNDDLFKVLAEEMNILRERNPDLVPGDVTSEALVEADEDIITADGVVRTDQEVLAEFQTDMHEDSQDIEETKEDDEPPLPPSQTDVRQAIEVLCQYSLFSQQGNDLRQKALMCSRIVEKEFTKKQRQTSMTNYFKK